ncbi:hypothetical protein TNCV_2472081 [Trichonephila clavipes]|nr:hypothetical protein TNCV_2472081 [Trichonephila clavipes]
MHRTWAYLRDWNVNQRLKKYSPFSLAKTLGLPSAHGKPHPLCPVGFDMELEEIDFHEELLGSHPTWGIDGNEKADFLARTAAEEKVSPTGSLLLHSSSLKKIELNQLGRFPPTYPSYLGRNPGGSFKLMPKKYETAFSRFV